MQRRPKPPAPSPSAASLLTQDTLVLNRGWMAIATTPVRHALSLLFTGSAQAIEPATFEVHDFESWVQLPLGDGESSISTVRMNLRVPEVIVLVSFSGVPKQHLPFTRQNLLRRDQSKCQYCGRLPGHTELSIDHVNPRARGGETSWENCVLACIQCNRRKGSKLPEQIGMKLITQPRAPQWSPIFEVAGSHKREAWRRFVADKHFGQANGKTAG